LNLPLRRAADIRGRIAELERAGVTTLITTPLAGDTARTLPREFIDSFNAAGLTPHRSL